MSTSEHLLRASASASTIAERDHITLTEAEARAFVGPRSDRYLAMWHKYLAGVSALPRFNFAAFFAAPLWLGYRRMYGLAIGWWVLLAAIFLTEELVLRDWAPAARRDVIRLTGFLMAVTAGRLGSYLYLLKAERTTRAVRLTSSDPDARREALARRGGVSWRGMIFAPLAGIGVVLVLLAALELGFGIGVSPRPAPGGRTLHASASR
jgi:hypothetical protein